VSEIEDRVPSLERTVKFFNKEEVPVEKQAVVRTLPEALRMIKEMNLASDDEWGGECREAARRAFSNLVLEALYSGTAIITDVVSLAECYGAEGINTKDLPGNILFVRTDNSAVAAEQISEFLEDCVPHRPVAFPSTADYDRYITANEEVLIKATKAGLQQSFGNKG
jgi:hypothetical protein